MNIVIISGKIVSDINFDFLYCKDKKHRNTSIAVGKMLLDNESIINVYGYDEISDYLYRNTLEYICVEGKIASNMGVEILKIH